MPIHIIVEKIGNIGKITFDRDPKMNSLMPEMMGEIMEALSEFDKDAEVRVVVFTGKGRAFSSGADMKFLERILEMEPFQIKQEVYT